MKEYVYYLPEIDQLLISGKKTEHEDDWVEDMVKFIKVLEKGVKNEK